MRVGIVVTAELGSARGLLPVSGETSGLTLMVRRLATSKLADQVVVATGDEAIAEIGAAAGAMGRLNAEAAPATSKLAEAAEAAEIGIVVAIAGVQPLVDSRVVDALVKVWRESAAHIVSCDKPEGCTMAVTSRAVLDQALRRHAEMAEKAVALFSPPKLGLRHLRFKAVDTPYSFALETGRDVPWIRALIEAEGPMASLTAYARAATLPELQDSAVLDDPITTSLAKLEG